MNEGRRWEVKQGVGGSSLDIYLVIVRGMCVLLGDSTLNNKLVEVQTLK